MVLSFAHEFCIVANLFICYAFEENVINLNNFENPTYLDAFQELGYGESTEKWLGKALRDIAYYLRNHKFNEWDRRYYIGIERGPPNIGFYDTFPTPSLNSIHWEVHKNCHNSFLKCVSYLYSVVKTAPFTRSDDINTSLNTNATIANFTVLQNKNIKCKRALLYMEKTGLPFGGPKEKFKWRTSASYYMCWYTMKENPSLSLLGEPCDNFAKCLDETFGSRNHDPRTDDKLSFACAMYSFCPDPCCPLKHIRSMYACYNSSKNPCYTENAKNNNKIHLKCSFTRKDNVNFEQMIQNRWNVSCHCRQKGFKWNSQFSMCVDINECTAKQHNCNRLSEDCLNLPGTYQCVCKWGFTYDKIERKCVEKGILMDPKSQETDRIKLNLVEKFSSLIDYLLL